MSYSEAKILIVDDEETNVRLLVRILQDAGYARLITTRDPAQTLPLYLEHQPDLLLLDLRMPRLDGYQILEQFGKLLPQNTFFPILVLTADNTSEAKERALSSGASDFVTKPFDRTEVLLRCKNLLQTRQLYTQLHGQKDLLEATVYERTQELEQTRLEIMRRLALAAEYRDDDSAQHIHRVGQLAALLGSTLELSEQEVVLLRRAAPLHDVGKIGIPDHILIKPGKLTPQEYEVVKTHTLIGAAILGGSNIALLEYAAQIALTHHERWDGSGYPQGLAGEEIPLCGRIVAVADVFDALTQARIYKPALPLGEAVALIESQSGRHFDPQVVRAFSALVRSQQLLQLAEESQGQAGRALARGASKQPAPRLAPPVLTSLPELLTPREREVLRLVVQGRTNRQIGELLSISTGTVKIHLEHIIGKLAVSDRTQAAVRAIQLGLVDS